MLVLGSANRKKGKELINLLRPLRIEVRTLADFSEKYRVEEEADSFAENARRKAIGYAQRLAQWVLAEDSGLEVEALGGRPGVLSARYAGPDADDEANNRLLLTEMAGIPLEKRAARYVCHVALADPQGCIQAESEACCCGRIAIAPRGRTGFGYDPLFEIPEYHRTFAELGPRVKAVLSHRSRAVRLMIPDLIQLVEAGLI